MRVAYRMVCLPVGGMPMFRCALASVPGTRLALWPTVHSWHKAFRRSQPVKPRSSTGNAPRMTPSPNPDVLLAAVARGDREAFATLYRTTSSLVFAICMQMLRDRAEAEDVLQDVYVVVWDKANQFDPRRAQATTWLTSIARHRAIDRLRAAPQLANTAPIELAEAVPDPTPSAATITDSAQQRARLDDCFAELEPQRRQLIRVAFFEGVTYEQLASRIKAPLGSVKSWIRRGLAQLRTCLEQ